MSGLLAEEYAAEAARKEAIISALPAIPLSGAGEQLLDCFCKTASALEIDDVESVSAVLTAMHVIETEENEVEERRATCEEELHAVESKTKAALNARDSLRRIAAKVAENEANPRQKIPLSMLRQKQDEYVAVKQECDDKLRMYDPETHSVDVLTEKLVQLQMTTHRSAQLRTELEMRSALDGLRVDLELVSKELDREFSGPI